MAKVLGIDLGTTNSCMAVMEGGEATVIPNYKDGVTVDKEIELPAPFENMSAQMVKEVASKNNDVAGDGRTVLPSSPRR